MEIKRREAEDKNLVRMMRVEIEYVKI